MTGQLRRSPAISAEARSDAAFRRGPSRRITLPDGLGIDVSDNEARGEPIVFLHGAVTDRRMWDPHRALIADRYRTIAFTQRYHGPMPAGAGWPAYGVRTHSADLIAMLETMGIGPVHLVAWSYSGHIAFHAALQRPDLFRSLFIYEPGVPSYVTDEAEIARFAQDAQHAFAPIFAAMHAGDIRTALERLIESSTGEPGSFSWQDPQVCAVQLENAHTLHELLSRQEAPPDVDAAQLSQLRVPVAIGYGERTRPLYAVPSAAAQKCLPNGRHFIVPAAHHLWPQEDPAGFVARLVAFIRNADARFEEPGLSRT